MESIKKRERASTLEEVLDPSLLSIKFSWKWHPWSEISIDFRQKFDHYLSCTEQKLSLRMPLIFLATFSSQFKIIEKNLSCFSWWWLIRSRRRRFRWRKRSYRSHRSRRDWRSGRYHLGGLQSHSKIDQAISKNKKVRRKWLHGRIRLLRFTQLKREGFAHTDIFWL